MTIDDLIAKLETIRELHGGDAIPEVCDGDGAVVEAKRVTVREFDGKTYVLIGE